MMQYSHLALLFLILTSFAGRLEDLQNKFGQVYELDRQDDVEDSSVQNVERATTVEDIFNALPNVLHDEMDTIFEHHVDLDEFKELFQENGDRRRLGVCDDFCTNTRYNGVSPGNFWACGGSWSNSEVTAYYDLKPKYETFFGTSFPSYSYTFHWWAMLYKSSCMDLTDKKAVSIMWAHMSQEAGSSLSYIKESGCPTEHPKCCNYGVVSGSGSCTQYSNGNNKYFGRGALQLSHESNYADFGCAMCSSVKDFPSWVENWHYPMASAVYYFKLNNMNQCSSNENAVVCFLRSVYKINGVQECKTSSTSSASDAGINRAEVTNRVNKFKTAYKAVHGFDLYIPSSCGGMSPSFYNANDSSFNCDFCDSGSSDYAGDCEDDVASQWYSPWMYSNSCPAYN